MLIFLSCLNLQLWIHHKYKSYPQNLSKSCVIINNIELFLMRYYCVSYSFMLTDVTSGA